MAVSVTDEDCGRLGVAIMSLLSADNGYRASSLSWKAATAPSSLSGAAPRSGTEVSCGAQAKIDECNSGVKDLWSNKVTRKSEGDGEPVGSVFAKTEGRDGTLEEVLLSAKC